MKHKRLIVTSTFIVFILVLLLDFVWLVRINETEIKFSSDGEISEELFGYANTTVKELSLGKSFLLLDTNKIADKISENPYISVESVKKEFPNRVTATLGERFEYFAIKSDEKYYYLDKDFILLRSSDELGGDVIELETKNVTFDFERFDYGKKIDYNSNKLFGNMVKIYEKIEDRFNTVSNVGIDAEQSRIRFFMRTGVCVEFRFAYLPNYSSVEDKNVTDETMVNSVYSVFDFYSALSEKEKNSGKVIVYPISTTEVNIEHIERETYA